MKIYINRLSVVCLLLCMAVLGLGLFYISAFASPSNRDMKRALQTPTPTQEATPIFRFPVVYDAEISGHFDHKNLFPWPQEDYQIYFYDGKISPNNSSGFTFICEDDLLSGDEEEYWVGCSGPGGTNGCQSPSQEMWYDNHSGIDFEYSPNWHTGPICDPDSFGNLTKPVYSPASGKVVEMGDTTYNGVYIRLAHDLNQNGNYDDDKIRSVYLHFANLETIAVNSIISEGTLLGNGNSTGLSWTPHLHFEVQRSTDINFNNRWSVDPSGWSQSWSSSSNAQDPWPYNNHLLWNYADGDVSCDGATGGVDVLFVMQYDIGVLSGQYICPLNSNHLNLANCDVNRDTKCSVVDALLILQCDVGMSNILCP